jgi:hypothetical protein
MTELINRSYKLDVSRRLAVLVKRDGHAIQKLVIDDAFQGAQLLCQTCHPVSNTVSCSTGGLFTFFNG